MSDNGFGPFFRKRFSSTVVLLIAMGADRTDAEDAAQESMILAWQQWESIREPSAWVRTVAVRTFLKQVRLRQQRRTDSLDELPHDLPDHGDLHLFTDQQQNTLRVLRDLPQQQRIVAALFYDGLACEEIATLTGKTPATIRSHLRHARKALKEAWESGDI